MDDDDQLMEARAESLMLEVFTLQQKLQKRGKTILVASILLSCARNPTRTKLNTRKLTKIQQTKDSEVRALKEQLDNVITQYSGKLHV